MIETIYAFACLLFSITLFLIIREVRLKREQLVKNALKNPFWPRTKLSFFLNTYRTYLEIKGANLIILLNIISLSIGLIGLIIIIFKALKNSI